MLVTRSARSWKEQRAGLVIAMAGDRLASATSTAREKEDDSKISVNIDTSSSVESFDYMVSLLKK